IRNERAVELCFEEHRWYDVLSWGEGQIEFSKPVLGMNIVKKNDGSFVYTPFQYGATPIFNDYMNLYPFPDDEVLKSKYLEQNPGWIVKTN
ncbi:MAG: RagB/SusD family nutrient uptake outer membrane protein, partial [Prevotellaceae bacterium]|nr:RagB/SusD family nutrient uptake outer membrane protein [Prevotellaceae bacterium]